MYNATTYYVQCNNTLRTTQQHTTQPTQPPITYNAATYDG